MHDLKNMDSWEAIRLAIEWSGKTRKEVASALGVNVGHINRYCSREDPHEPSLDMIRRLCLVLGNTVLLKWVEAKLDTSDAHIPAPESRAQVLTALARAVAALGEANRLAAETEARGITPADAREIRSTLLDVIGESRFAMGMLQHIAEHRGVDTYPPLASLKLEEKAKLAWWKRLFKKQRH